MYKDIVHTLEFTDDLDANEKVNKLLKEGWTLLHIGTVDISKYGDDQACYQIGYVVGATKDIYDSYVEKQNKSTKLDDLRSQLI
ncbi:hypothetical protein LJB88_04960 [Erysipelotrichaceae bacterium OttesenSCG-928-M19]|nr:hypothetical protein [Erysipelotrichaceae bacterium OttesenSCG-928-M19]